MSYICRSTERLDKSQFPRKVYDPGGEPEPESYAHDLLRVLHDLLPISRGRSSVLKSAYVLYDGVKVFLDKLTLDTGASSGNYLGRDFLRNFSGVSDHFKPCHHVVKLGDGKTRMRIEQSVTVDIQLINDDGSLEEPITTEFYIANNLGMEGIIGLPALTGNYFEYFERVLSAASGRKTRSTLEKTIADQNRDFLDIESELRKTHPSRYYIDDVISRAKKKGSEHRKSKEDCVTDDRVGELFATEEDAKTESTPHDSLRPIVREN